MRSYNVSRQFTSWPDPALEACEVIVSLPEYFAWNPTVYDGFGDTMTFYLIQTRTLKKEKLYDDLAQLLQEEGYTSYRIYHIFGEASIILKVWIKKGAEEHFARLIETNVHQVRSAEAHVVWDIPHHWKWGPIDFQAKALEKLTPAFIDEIQHSYGKCFSISVNNAIDDGLLREVRTNLNNVTFFSFIKSNEHELTRRNLGMLVEAAKLLLEKKREQISFTALYYLRGTQSRLLIKGEAKDFFHIGNFITELNDTLALSDCVTLTCIVASKPVIGREEIGKRSFEQIEHRDVAVAQILPELYDAKELNEPLKERIVAWTKKNLVAREWKKKDIDRENLRAALTQVIAGNEDRFSNALNAIFRATERPLRDLQGRFIEKHMGHGKLNQTITEALHHLPNADKKKLTHLTLGDRIQVYVHVFRCQNITDDEELLTGWEPIVALRNDIAHNTRDLLPEWESHMGTILSFIGRYPKLIQIIENS